MSVVCDNVRHDPTNQRRETNMGYYKNLIIAQQVEEPDRTRKARRRETYKEPEMVTDRRTINILLWSTITFGLTTVILTGWVAILL